MSNVKIMDKSFKILGVCGGICSGKSLACRILRDFPETMAYIDADSLAHKVYTPGSQAIEDIRSYFGASVIDASSGTVNRKELGAIVFNDRGEMAALERIVWPYVKQNLEKELDRLRTNISDNSGNIVVVEAAVMLDADWSDLFDGIWVVRSPEEVVLNRLVKNRGLTLDEANSRVNAQASRRGIGNVDEEFRNGVVTAVIENEGAEEDLSNKLKESWISAQCWKGS